MTVMLCTLVLISMPQPQFRYGNRKRATNRLLEKEKVALYTQWNTLSYFLSAIFPFVAT